MSTYNDEIMEVSVDNVDTSSLVIQCLSFVSLCLMMMVCAKERPTLPSVQKRRLTSAVY